jgi:hypothetical protein
MINSYTNYRKNSNDLKVDEDMIINILFYM